MEGLVLEKRGIIWTALLLIIIGILVIPASREVFESLTESYPYIMGFIKFTILATMGEILSLRIKNRRWKRPTGVVYRAIIWGFLGIWITMVFSLFNSGVASLQTSGMLPGEAGGLSLAFQTSLFMNIIFAPTMMGFHRITDTYVDKYARGKRNIKLNGVVKDIDWEGFVTFVLLKTIPFFWIPAHTIVFLMPDVYRIIAAAFLSIALGGILAFAAAK